MVFFLFSSYKKSVGVDSFILKTAFSVFLHASGPFFFLFACFENTYRGTRVKHVSLLFSERRWLGGDHWQVLLVKTSLSYILLEEITALNIIPGANPLHLKRDSNLQKIQDNPLIKKLLQL